MVRPPPPPPKIARYVLPPPIRRFPNLSYSWSFFTYSWSFLLTVNLLCLQSLKALIRRIFPL